MGWGIELDSHECAFAAGRNYTLLHCTNRICDIMPCLNEHEAKTNIHIAQVATGYAAESGRRCMLVMNEELCVLDLEISLMSPNQLRDYGVQGQEYQHYLDLMIM